MRQTLRRPAGAAERLWTFRAALEYDGSRYSGSQEQINARTVMGELRKAAEEVFGGRVELQAAGRTDAGVHALAQVAHLRTSSPAAGKLSTEVLLREFNDRLPVDIVMLGLEPAPARFHARHDAVSRTYVYRISRRKSAFHKKFVWWVKEPLDVPLMSRAARSLMGRHNFHCFRAPDPARPDESPIVVVDSAEIEDLGDVLVFRIEASHFLWRMVRRLTGALVMLGKGSITWGQFAGLLEGQCDPARLDVAAWTAPAAGLFLELVKYPPDERPPGRKRT